jgi:threonine/homoserine/homoserine lactone efflux protein
VGARCRYEHGRREPPFLPTAERTDMPSAEVLFAFVVTTSLFAFIPGPAMFYAAARTMAGGRRAGFMAVLGIHLGAYFHIVAAAAGLIALFHAVPIAYAAVKIVGAIYLIWLGISLFRAKASFVTGLAETTAGSSRKAFAQSVIVEVLNPKTAIFFVAFLPQFVDASAGFPLWVQFVILGAIVNLIFTLADVLSVVLADVVLGKMRRSSGVQKIVQRIGGMILVGLGTRLAMERS